MKDFIETRIIKAVQKLLAEQVNKILQEIEYQVPVIEFGSNHSGHYITPMVSLSSCERTEKERIIRLEAYSLTIIFELPESHEAELYCYAYAGAVSRAVYEDPSFGGLVDRVVITGKKFIQPKKPNCGEAWSVVLTLRLTVEGIEG